MKAMLVLMPLAFCAVVYLMLFRHHDCLEMGYSGYVSGDGVKECSRGNKDDDGCFIVKGGKTFCSEDAKYFPLLGADKK